MVPETDQQRIDEVRPVVTGDEPGAPTTSEETR